MKITYDPEADAAYIQLANTIPTGSVARTVECQISNEVEPVAIDLDINGKIVGIEILSARNLLPPEAID